jgi:hypothetical protein
LSEKQGGGERGKLSPFIDRAYEQILELTLSYSSKINGYLYPQRVSPPLKKRCDMFSEGNAAHLVRRDSPL